MLGNISQTIVKVPNFFNLLAKLSSKEFEKTRYREPPLLDTYSTLNRVNSNLNKRYFCLNDHFKENALYKDLNYNNNKRYLSSITKLPKRSLHDLFYIENVGANKNLKRNKSQLQIIRQSKNNSINLLTKDSLNQTNPNDIISNIRFENDRYNVLNPLNDEKNFPDININNKNINENNRDFDNNNENDENNKNIENKIDDEKIKIEKYMKKLRDYKPKNIEELKQYLDIKYMEETNNNNNILPRIRGIHKSISQDDLFKKTIKKKIESLTMIRPEVKNSIYRRQKNIVLKRDYDLIHKIYANHTNSPFYFKNNLNTNNKNTKELID